MGLNDQTKVCDRNWLKDIRLLIFEVLSSSLTIEVSNNRWRCLIMFSYVGIKFVRLLGLNRRRRSNVLMKRSAISLFGLLLSSPSSSFFWPSSYRMISIEGRRLCNDWAKLTWF